MRWFAVYTHPNKEAAAVARLRQQNFETFYPFMLVTRRHARKSTTVSAPFFPRYAFVRLDLDMHRWRSVNGTIGVYGLVMNGERPCAIPEGIVEMLAARAGQDGLITGCDSDADDGLQPGDTVRLTAGPFSGEIGTLLRLSGRGRVEMLIALMNGAVRVRVARSSLEAAA